MNNKDSTRVREQKKHSLIWDIWFIIVFFMALDVAGGLYGLQTRPIGAISMFCGAMIWFIIPYWWCVLRKR